MKIAPLWNRVGGALIDLIVVFVITLVICFLWGFFIGLEGKERYLSSAESDALWQGRGMLVGLLVDCVYTVLTMTGAKQATFGQRAVGVKITKDNGAPIGYGAALGRWFVSLFSSILLKIGFLIAIFTKNKKTLHDLMAGTIVIESAEEGEQKSQVADEYGRKSDPQIKNHKVITPASKKIETMEDAYGRIAPTDYKALMQSGQVSVEKKESQKDQLLDIDEDAIWAKALAEYDSENRNKGLWARLYVENDGDEEKLKVSYIKIQAQKLIKEAIDAKNEKQKYDLQERELQHFDRLKKNISLNSPLENFEIGMRIYKGNNDVAANPAESFIYLYKAAIGGVPDAQFNLSLMYWKGDGVQKNKAEAYAWCRIASNAVMDAKSNMNFYSKNMQLTEILESDELTRKYVELIQKK